MLRKLMIVIIALVSVSWRAASAAEWTYQPWDELLKRFVQAGRVDYQGLRANRAALNQWLQTLSAANPDQLGSERRQQLAFWINAYNACVFQGVLEHAPLASVRDVKGFFDKITYRVAGEMLTLNQMEAKGRAFEDWRIHVAVVCASTSCPPLRSEAYVPERLDEQLADQARQFLRDTHHGMRLEGSTLRVSKIFHWYAGDFLKGDNSFLHKLTPAKLLSTLRPYLEPATAEACMRHAQQLQFLDYDWSLNQQAP